MLNYFKYFVICILGENVEKRKRKIAKRTISSLYVLNCFKYFLIYILIQNISKNIRQERFWTMYMLLCVKYFLIHILAQNTPKYQIRKLLNYIKSSFIIFYAKMFRTSILYTPDALEELLSKNWFYFFFLTCKISDIF